MYVCMYAGFRTSTPSGRDANVPAGEGILGGGPPHYPQEGRSAKKYRHPAPKVLDRSTDHLSPSRCRSIHVFH